MSFSATPPDMPPHRSVVLSAEPPSTLDALAEKLLALQTYSSRYGITRPATELLEEILDDVRRVQATAEAEWISPGQAADICGLSMERLRQLGAAGRVQRNGSRFRRGEIQRLHMQRARAVAPTVHASVESPPVSSSNADRDECAFTAPKSAPSAGSPGRIDAPHAAGDEGVRNPITGRVLGIHSTIVRQ